MNRLQYCCALSLRCLGLDAITVLLWKLLTKAVSIFTVHVCVCVYVCMRACVCVCVCVYLLLRLLHIALVMLFLHQCLVGKEAM